jgi:cytochrome d ubiquinol oxidase subunit II
VIASQIGPIWEANHVWLILVVVLLFTAFPAAFASLGIVLHIPLSLMLIGIVLRGSSFVFRSYGSRDDATQQRWGRVFAMASVITPILLGVVVGAVASGAAGAAADRLAAARDLSFASEYVAPWLSPFPLSMGVLALAMFAFLAAVYLALATDDAALREDFRRRALGAAVAMFVAAFGGLAVAHVTAPHVSGALTGIRAIAFQATTAVAAVAALWAVWTRRWRTARIAAALQVSLILWGWVLVQYPYVVPPTLTIHDAAAPRATLELLIGALVGGALLLFPALVYLFRIFAPKVR